MRAVPWETQPALDSWIQRECFLFPLHCFSTDNKDGTETFSNTNSSPYLTTWRLSSFYQFVDALTGVPRKRSQLFDLIICVICIYLFLIVSTHCLTDACPSHYSDTKIFVCYRCRCIHTSLSTSCMYVGRERCMYRDIVYFIIYMYIYDIFRIENIIDIHRWRPLTGVASTSAVNSSFNVSPQSKAKGESGTL